MKSTRLRLGQFWKERLDKNLEVPNGVTLEHPHVVEYINSLEEKVEKPKKKKVK